jgi:fructokinase
MTQLPDESKVLVCGEALYDVFCSERDGALQMEARAAGSPFNVAVGLARLGQPVAFCGGLSSGALGQRLRAHLEHEGVDCSLCPAFEAPTTLSVVETDAAGVPRYTFYGHGGADRLLSGVPELSAEIAAIQIGSYPLVVEPVAHALRSLVERERERERGRRVVTCDLNLRASVEPALDRWRHAAQWLTANVQLMKASDEDVAALWPCSDVDRVAQGWLDAGCELVVITHGANGVSAWNRRSTLRVPSRPIRVVDTVGAGDAFQAALLHRLAQLGCLKPGGLRDLDPAMLREVLEFANRAAAWVCTRRGADPGRRDDLEAMAI